MPDLFSAGYCVETPSWHKKEDMLAEAPKTVQESLQRAGQDWDVGLEDVFDNKGINVNHIGRLIRRLDNGHPLAIVGPNTHVLQNREAFGIFQQFIDSGDVTLDTAGCLDEGRKVWTLAKLNRANVEIVKNDEVYKYLLVSNSHDGTLAVRVGFTPVRVVCWNTLSAAIFSKDAHKSLIKIRHSSKVVQKVKDAGAVIDRISNQFDTACEAFQLLARKGITGTQTKEYFKTVFDMKPDDEMPKQSITTLERLIALEDENRQLVNELLAKDVERKEIEAEAQQVIGSQVLDQLLNNMEAGIGTDNAPSRGTFWTAYNAITQYLTHERGRSSDTRLASLWYGNSYKVNEKAVKVALEMAGISDNRNAF